MLIGFKCLLMNMGINFFVVVRSLTKKGKKKKKEKRQK